jgi:hypothetical protein
MNAQDVRQVKDTLQGQLRILIRATVALYLGLALVFGYAFVQAERNRMDLETAAEQTSAALCALRADLERRVATSENFLERNPDGIPGISAKTIQDGIDNTERSIEALAGLDC